MKTLKADEIAELAREASALPRRRSHLNWHDPAHDPVQRFWIQLQPGTYVRPHCHAPQQRLETTVLIEGTCDLLLFGADGTLQQRLRLAGGALRAVELTPDQWHSYVALEATTLFEVKQGPYDPGADKLFADWAPAENTSEAAAFLQRMSALKPGQSLR